MTRRVSPACRGWLSVMVTMAFWGGAAAAQPEPSAGAAGQLRLAIQRLAAGDRAGALEACNAALQQNPRLAAAWTCRGGLLLAQGQYERAVRDFTLAIRLDPRSAYGAYTGRGMAWRRLGRFGRAVADYHQAIRLNPVHGAAAYNALAWLQATAPDEAFRDGREAVLNARQACRETDWRKAEYLGTLAAACAEAGQFDEAVKWQEEALRLAGDGYDREAAERRLAEYRAGRPHRDAPPPMAAVPPTAADAASR